MQPTSVHRDWWPKTTARLRTDARLCFKLWPTCCLPWFDRVRRASWVLETPAKANPETTTVCHQVSFYQSRVCSFSENICTIPKAPDFPYNRSRTAQMLPRIAKGFRTCIGSRYSYWDGFSSDLPPLLFCFGCVSEVPPQLRIKFRSVRFLRSELSLVQASCPVNFVLPDFAGSHFPSLHSWLTPRPRRHWGNLVSPGVRGWNFAARRC
jgi:hypothetical protein